MYVLRDGLETHHGCIPSSVFSVLGIGFGSTPTLNRIKFTEERMNEYASRSECIFPSSFELGKRGGQRQTLCYCGGKNPQNREPVFKESPLLENINIKKRRNVLWGTSNRSLELVQAGFK